jgi:phage terminase large subunit
MVDLIRTNNLQMFEVQSQKITHKIKGSTINFRGFREQGSFNIQGMEGVDIVWIDEAQAVTKQTLDVLIPTIRKDNAKIFFSMNRHVENDPVYSTFHKRDDCLHIKINFFDNPFCTAALIKESEECKKISEKDYNHIWLGEPLDMAEDCVFSRGELVYGKNNPYPLREGYGIRVAGFDIARYGEDKNAVVVLQQMGALHWQTILVDQWEKKDLNFTTGRILHTSNQQNVAKAIIDEDGLGAGPFDTLSKGRGLDYFVGFRNPVIGYQNNKEFGNPRTINAYKARRMLMDGHLHIMDDSLIDELMTIKYTFDHNQRRILVSKEKMRADGFKSPNLADALIMAVSLIGTVSDQQNAEYQPKLSHTSKEESLFTIAGIR